MKKLLTVTVAIFAILTVTGCGTTFDQGRADRLIREADERTDRLYKECIDAGGSFWVDENDGPDIDYSCILPNTDVPANRNIDVEVNN